MGRAVSCNRNLAIRRHAPDRIHKNSPRQDQRANLRRINHIAYMALILERLASSAGLTITSCLLHQTAEEAWTTSAKLEQTAH